MSVEFARRHIGLSAEEQRRMLDAIGYGSVDELMDAAIPGVIRNSEPLRLPRFDMGDCDGDTFARKLRWAFGR